ncbi:MAG TPA: Hsp20/alpha crystallin family protein [Candidatus Paceibacterota bacterium]|nr:Hsp20/alpha crystallin family protein [Candidatus Paceibacterota bacterium]
MSNSEEKFFESLAKGASPKDEHSHPNRHYNVKDDKEDSEEKMLPKKTNENNADMEGKLTIDVYQTPTEIVVESAIAGIKPEDLDINVSSDSITIKGERRHEEEIKEEDYFYQECYWGRFSRSVILPEEVDPDSATVNFKNGVLTVKLPKVSKKKAKKLKVNAE